MIFDKLENAGLYTSISPNLAAALNYLLENKEALDRQPLEVTKLTPDVQVKFIEYETMPYPRRWESHLEFTDLQYMIRGRERIGCCHTSLLRNPVRQEGKDQIIYQGDGDRILVPEGHFIILFPQDAHMSKLYAGERVEKVKKAAFKIRL